MKLIDFSPTDTTGPEQSDMLFRSYLTGPQGAHYELFKEADHTHADVMKAQKYIRHNFDPVSIRVINETL